MNECKTERVRGQNEQDVMVCVCLCVCVCVCVCVRVLVSPRRTCSFRHTHGAVDHRLASVEQAHRLPVSEWKASHVLAWLDVDMHMAAYRQACFDNIKSGKVASYLYYITPVGLLPYKVGTRVSHFGHVGSCHGSDPE